MKSSDLATLLQKTTNGWIDPIMIILSLGFVKGFNGLISTIMFFQIALVIISLTPPEYLEKSFDIFIKTCVTQYRDDVDLQNLIDYTQLNFECCGGVEGPEDWNENAYFKCDNKIIINGIQWSPVEECGVPFSCCLNATIDDNPNRQCGYGVRKTPSSLAVTETFYQTGCTQK